MHYQCRYDRRLDIVEAVTHGLADLTGLRQMLEEIVALCARERTANILVDHSGLNPMPLSMDDIKTLSGLCIAMANTLRGRKCAHVVSGDLQYGLVRAWEIMNDCNGFDDFETRLFLNRNDAVAWLQDGR